MKIINHQKLICLGLTFGMFLTACTSIQLISNYDESVDKQAQDLQKKLDTYFISLQNLQGEPITYKENQKFYEGVLADINALEARAGIIYKNSLTQEQVHLVKQNFAYLILLHKNCINNQPKLTKEQIAIIDKKGVDLSLDCNTEFGSPVQLSNRGNQSLNRYSIPIIQQNFRTQLAAIMKFELVKKRGEKNK
ncbi:MAG: hypothetical protein ACK4GA_02480 [Acinetobacter sp.]|uniref:hypothetical protein n=1 Tax=Acinetobacter sp. TaxID=472 RepID=UPI00391AEA4D